MQPATDTEILTAAEAAAYLGLSEAGVMGLIQLDEWMNARAAKG